MSEQAKTTSVAGSAALVTGLLLLLVGERVFGAGTSWELTTGAGALVLLAALAMRLRAFLAATGDTKGVEARLLISYMGVFMALAGYALSTTVVMDVMALEPETSDRVQGVLSVLWPSIMVVSLSALLFMELVYLRMPIAESVELRRVRTAAHAGLTLGLSVVFLFSINYVAFSRNITKDVSYFKTTEPSDGTRALVSKLDKPVRVILFYQRANDVLTQVAPYFETLAAGSDMLSFEVKDVALVPDIAKKHRIRGNGNLLLIKGEKEEEKGESLKIGTELTAARRVLRKLDGEFQQIFRKLVMPSRSLHLTVGHGERNAKSSDVPSADGTAIMRQILKRLNLKTKDLGPAQGLGSAVPDGASAVAILGPQQKFLPEEAQVLLEYVRKGGRLMLMIDPDVEVGLEPLLKGLGVEVEPGTLASEKHHMRRTFGPADRGVVYSNSYTSHPTVTTVSRHSREVATVFVNGASVKRAVVTGMEPKPKVTFPLRSASDFWRDLDGNFMHDQGEPKKSVNMVAAITLSAGKESEGRAVIIGDGDFITDKLAGNNGNMLLFVDSLAWLIGNEELSGEVASEEDIPLEHSRDEDRIYFYLTTFAVPGPILLFGLWIARRRRRVSEAES